MLRQFSLPIFEQPCWRNNQHWFGVIRVGPQPEQEHECLECLAQTHIVGEQDARQLAPPCFGQPGTRIALVRFWLGFQALRKSRHLTWLWLGCQTGRATGRERVCKYG